MKFLFYFFFIIINIIGNSSRCDQNFENEVNLKIDKFLPFSKEFSTTESFDGDLDHSQNYDQLNVVDKSQVVELKRYLRHFTIKNSLNIREIVEQYEKTLIELKNHGFDPGKSFAYWDGDQIHYTLNFLREYRIGLMNLFQKLSLALNCKNNFDSCIYTPNSDDSSSDDHLFTFNSVPLSNVSKLKLINYITDLKNFIYSKITYIVSDEQLFTDFPQTFDDSLACEKIKLIIPLASKLDLKNRKIEFSFECMGTTTVFLYDPHSDPCRWVDQSKDDKNRLKTLNNYLPTFNELLPESEQFTCELDANDGKYKTRFIGKENNFSQSDIINDISQCNFEKSKWADFLIHLPPNNMIVGFGINSLNDFKNSLISNKEGELKFTKRRENGPSTKQCEVESGLLRVSDGKVIAGHARIYTSYKNATKPQFILNGEDIEAFRQYLIKRVDR